MHNCSDLLLVKRKSIKLITPNAFKEIAMKVKFSKRDDLKMFHVLTVEIR